MMTISSWFQKPYDPDMDVWHWILFIILVLVVAAGWAHTVRILQKAV